MSMIEGVTDGLHKELIKLADILETCEIGSPEYKNYVKEYRKVAKILYPDKYKANGQRKPRKSFIGTLKRCTCGSNIIKLRRVDGKSQFSCNCGRQSESCDTQALARDSWNKTFKTNTNENNQDN
jgi:hypothetical protein